MKHGSLFSGIGGFDLAAEWMGWQNIFHCEKDRFCRMVLDFYWPNSTSYGDIHDFKANGYKGNVDLISAGFPCQPFSLAGKRRGKNDNRYLFPQALRIINEAKPPWIILENVAGLFTILEPESISEMEYHEVELFCKDDKQVTTPTVLRIQRRVIGTIISEIQSAGYVFPTLTDNTPIVLCVPACAVNSPQRRDRIWLVAYRRPVANTYGIGAEKQQIHRNAESSRKEAGKFPLGFFKKPNGGKWLTEPPFCSTDDGLSEGLDSLAFHRMRRLSIQALGNSIVPEVAYTFFQAIEWATLSNDYRQFQSFSNQH